MRKVKKVLMLETADDDAHEAMEKTIDYLMTVAGLYPTDIIYFAREPYVGKFEKITIEFIDGTIFRRHGIL